MIRKRSVMICLDISAWCWMLSLSQPLWFRSSCLVQGIGTTSENTPPQDVLPLTQTGELFAYLQYFICVFDYFICVFELWHMYIIVFIMCVARVTTALLDKINENLAENRKKEKEIKEKIIERYVFSVASHFI